MGGGENSGEVFGLISSEERCAASLEAKSMKASDGGGIKAGREGERQRESP